VKSYRLEKEAKEEIRDKSGLQEVLEDVLGEEGPRSPSRRVRVQSQSNRV